MWEMCLCYIDMVRLKIVWTVEFLLTTTTTELQDENTIAVELTLMTSSILSL